MVFRLKKNVLVVMALLCGLSLFLYASDIQARHISPHFTLHYTKLNYLSPDYARLVNPFTGTGVQQGASFGGGNTFPGATVPFGMVQWSPDTLNNPPGGYAFTDRRIKGFSLTHLSGSGCRIYQDIPFLPYTGTITSSPGTAFAQYVATFSHANEMAYAGYYKVRLDNGVTTELTATQRTGEARFTYPIAHPATLLVNVSGSVNGVAQAQANINGNTISGFVSSGRFCNQTAHYTVYFFARFNKPFASYGAWHNRTVSRGDTRTGGRYSGVYVTFNTSGSTVITASVGLSFVSVANAQANLNAENPFGNFNRVQVEAARTWNRFLGEIRLSGGSSAQVSTFYTALYHVLLQPGVFSDANGEYIGFDDKIHMVAPGHVQYANFSEWDIYRSEAQLLTLLAPSQASDMAQSLVNDYLQSGTLPKWGVANWDTGDMVGDPADAVIADIYAFGGTHFNTATALSAMIQQATKPNRVRLSGQYLLSIGYVPLVNQQSLCGQPYYGSAACSLEYNTADFALGAFARALGDTANYQRFVNRAQDWSKLLNAKAGYLEPRYANGAFPAPYSSTSTQGWVEGDGAQYTWMVPFNLSGLFQALGGKHTVISRLNTFFTQLNSRPNSPYALLGNEPSLETPWEYDYAGAPYRTQNVVRRIENALYTTGPGGLPGNDDLGELSSWYVWAALGMYPETPGTANLVLSSPLFPAIVIKRPSGQTITINAPGASASTFYVQSLTVNSVASNNPWLPPTFIARGGTLNYTLSTTANPTWGADAANAPPSYGAIVAA